MLYDIMPPLVFFASFGGVIVLVSRVVMRTRRQELAHTMHMQARRTTGTMPEYLLSPGRSGVELLKNRVSAAASNLRQSVRGAKTYWQTRRERKTKHAVPEGGGISIPAASWRDRTASFFARASQQVRQTAGHVHNMAALKIRQPKTTPVSVAAKPDSPKPVPTTATAPPQIRIIRVESPVTKPEKITKAAEPAQTSPQGRFIARLKKSEAPKPSTLEAAQKAIDAGKYEQAEELLVPYIVDHARDCRAYILLGKVAAARGSWEEAMEIYEQAVHLEPDKTAAQAGLGHAALQQGKFTIALRALQRAHICDPADIGILHEILDIARRLDNKILQKSTLEQLVELEPQDENLAQALSALKAKENAHS